VNGSPEVKIDDKQRPFLLHVLRGWGSTVPLLSDKLSRVRGTPEGAIGAVRGGGYLIRTCESSIAVDPGFQFVENFLESGLPFSGVDSIIVTHDHPDHSDDLWSFDNLMYEMFNRAERKDCWRYRLYVDSDTHARWEVRERRYGNRPNSFRQTLSVTKLDAESLVHRGNEGEKYREVSVPFVPYVQRPQETYSKGAEGTSREEHAEVGYSIKNGLKLRYWRTQHALDVLNSIGFSLRLGDDFIAGGATNTTNLLAYSSDASSVRESQFFDEAVRSVTVLVHVSEPELLELSTGGLFRKPDHMGLYGLFDLVKAIADSKGHKTKLLVVGEFWGGKGDTRRFIIRQVRYWLDLFDLKDIGVVPSDIGLKVDLMKGEVMCSGCSGWFEGCRIRSWRSSHGYSRFSYLCHTCEKAIDSGNR